MKDTCNDMSTPVEEDKCEGPATILPFIGIELDTVKLEIRLPADKLQRLQEQTREWRGKKAGTKRDLLSLIGTLNHACKAVRQGRSFLRWLIDLSKVAQHLHHHIRLNLSARSDIQWWYPFAATWNGVSMLLEHKKQSPDVVVTSDASGNWGCGAYCESQWFQLQWGDSTKTMHITIKEFIRVVIAAAIWESNWAGKAVLIRTADAAVVAVVNSSTSRDHEVLHLMRCLVFISVKFNFIFSAAHIHNQLADALPRDNCQHFVSQYPQAQRLSSPIPEALVELLMISKPDLTSPHWRSLCGTI